MRKPNKVITVNFEIDENGIIAAIYSRQACNDFVKAVIKRAHEDIENGLILEPPANDTINPAEKLLLDVNYILQGGFINNLPNEN